MKNIRSTGLKLLIPTIIALSLSACGGGGGDSASATTPVAFVTPTLSFTDPQSTWDLANYTQTGSCQLDVGSKKNLLADEASGVTYNKKTDSLFVVGDGATSVVQIRKTITSGQNCKTIDSMVLNGGDFADTEGITYDATSNKLVLVEERLRQVDQFTYVAGGTLKRVDASAVVLGSTVTNVGIEGVSYDPQTNGYIAVRQSQPTSIFRAAIDFSAHTAIGSDGNPITVATTNPPFLFDAAKTGLSAFNDVFALSNIVPTNAPDYGDVMIIGASDGKIVKMDRTGKLLSTLSMSTTAQNEGMTMAPDGTIYVVGEQAAGPSVPGMTIFTPTTNSTNVGVGSNLYLTFNQPVMAGSGDIVIDNGAGDKRAISVTDTSQVSFSGKIMKINPKAFLTAQTSYNITYAAGVVKGSSGADAPAVSDASTFAFTTIGTPDTAVPTLSSTAPVDSATGIIGDHFTLFFNEAVQAGTGNIAISDGSDVRIIDIADTKQVKFNGSRLTVTLNPQLKNSLSTYTVQVGKGVVTDLSGNDADAIAPVSFMTAAAGAPVPTILISEVNSNADGGDSSDFFELYNYGDDPVDLTGWKWGDSHGDVNDPNNTAAFVTGKTIAAHTRLVVASAAPTDLAAFQTFWGGLSSVDVVPMVAIGNASTIGLGKADAVIVYDANGNVVSSFNYGPALETAIGSGDYKPVPTSNGVIVVNDHAGPSVSGGSSMSAVWDEVTPTQPNTQHYVQVTTMSAPLVAPGDSTGGTIGSPGF